MIPIVDIKTINFKEWSNDIDVVSDRVFAITGTKNLFWNTLSASKFAIRSLCAGG